MELIRSELTVKHGGGGVMTRDCFAAGSLELAIISSVI